MFCKVSILSLKVINANFSIGKNLKDVFTLKFCSVYD